MDRLSILKASDALYCLDREEIATIPIRGDFWGTQYAYLQVNLLPCSYKLHPDEQIPPECVNNLTAVQ